MHSVFIRLASVERLGGTRHGGRGSSLGGPWVPDRGGGPAATNLLGDSPPFGVRRRFFGKCSSSRDAPGPEKDKGRRHKCLQKKNAAVLGLQFCSRGDWMGDTDWSLGIGGFPAYLMY